MTAKKRVQQSLLSRGARREMQVSFHVSTTLPRQTPALFPYTTLFRSRPRAGNEHGLVGPVRVDLAEARLEVLRREDRKSTRLNSSHVSTSYAVFCLKKKKKLYDGSRLRR